MFDVHRILAIPDESVDYLQMGISGIERAELKDRGFVRQDGTKAKDYMIRTIQKTEKNKANAEKAIIKGDKPLTDKELKQAQYEKKEAFRDRVSKLMYAPVGVAPTEAKALKMIKSMDERELAKYESKANGKQSRRYTVGTEKAKKRINDLQTQINSLAETVATQEQAIRKAQSAKADRAGRNVLKKIGKDNPYGLESDGISSPWTKSAQKIREMESDLGKSTQELEKLKAKRSKLQSVWGVRIAVKERKDAQSSTPIAPDTAKKIKGAIAGVKGGKVVKGVSPRDRGIPPVASSFIKGNSKNHTVFYNGKVVNMDYLGKKPKDEFKFAGMRIADNLSTSGVGFIKTPKGEYYQVSTANRSAKKVSEKEVLDSVRQSKLKQPSAAQKMNMTDAEYAAFKKKVKRL